MPFTFTLPPPQLSMLAAVRIRILWGLGVGLPLEKILKRIMLYLSFREQSLAKSYMLS